ncbi:MAG: hypothetical protein K2N47_05290, partial [Clostridia bacterium]|nr:hypothetical protein [Clostridia bacterium]
KGSEELAQLRLQMETLLKQFEEIKLEKAEFNRRMSELKAEIEKKEQEIEDLKQKYIVDMATAKREHENEIAAITAGHAEETEAIKAEYADKLNATIGDYEAKVGDLSSQLDNLNALYANAVTDCDRRIAEMKFQMTDYENEKKRLTDALDAKLQSMEQACADNLRLGQEALEAERAKMNDDAVKLKEELAFIRGELDSIRIQQGKMTPSADYTSQDRFQELEKEYEAFQKFFKKQWDITKKEIRKSILWDKGEKKKPMGE